MIFKLTLDLIKLKYSCQNITDLYTQKYQRLSTLSDKTMTVFLFVIFSKLI